MEKILITGAAGFLGRQLSDFLEKKIQTVDVDDLSVRPLLKPKKKLIKMKVENISEGFLKKKSIMTIIHLAAKKSVDQSFYKLSNSIENYSMTIKLLTSASKSGVKNFFSMLRPVKYLVIKIKNSTKNLNSYPTLHMQLAK